MVLFASLWYRSIGEDGNLYTGAFCMPKTKHIISELKFGLNFKHLQKLHVRRAGYVQSYRGIMRKSVQESIKKAFLEHIGKVIHRNRNRKGMSQTRLANLVDVSHTTIGKYEAGYYDITASMMAYISTELEFPLSEYIEGYDWTENGELVQMRIDDLIRELVASSDKGTMMKEMFLMGSMDIVGTELNTDTNQYEFSMGASQSEASQYSANAMMLRECMMHDETGATELLRYMYALTRRYDGGEIPMSLKRIISASLMYAKDLLDGQSRHYVEEYIKELL